MIEYFDFTTVEEMFDFFSPWGMDPSLSGYVFRGHSQQSYELVPSALRKDNIDNFWEGCSLGRPGNNQHEWLDWQFKAEFIFLREFYRLADQKGLQVPHSNIFRNNLAAIHDHSYLLGIADQRVWIPRDLSEVAALAQHYGIPTRLLDWTYDIYVALYFAMIGAIGKDGKLEIWAIAQDTISLINTSTQRTNIEFITPHYAGNPNLNAQKGLFTHWPIVLPSREESIQHFINKKVLAVDRRPLDVLLTQTYPNPDNTNFFKRFTLPCSEAKKGCVILNKLGYDTSRIFPGYSGIAKQILTQNKYLV